MEDYSKAVAQLEGKIARTKHNIDEVRGRIAHWRTVLADHEEKLAGHESELNRLLSIHRSELDKAEDQAEEATAILESVAEQYHTSVPAILADGRKQHIVMIRDIAIYLIRTTTGLSFPKIGQMMGRDHSTVIHSCQLIAREMQNRGPAFAQGVERAARTARVSNGLGQTCGLNGKGQGVISSVDKRT